MTTITALPTPPSSSSPANFDTRADALLGALPTFVTETNAVATEVNAAAASAATSAGTATTQATTATTQASAAAASAAAAAASAGATLWVTGTNYTAPAVVVSPTNYTTYRTTTSGVSSTDPAADTTGRWVSAMLPSPSALAMPATRPTLVFAPAGARGLDRRFAFSRTGTSTRINAVGGMELQSAGVPRFDHHPTTLAPLGILIEPSGTNRVLRSSELDNASWVKTNTTITANGATGPYGATLDLVAATATGGNAAQNTTITSGATVTISGHGKAGASNFLRVEGGGGPCAWFNLSTGAVSGSGGSTATAVYSTAGIEPTSVSGVYRWWVTFTTATITTFTCRIYPTATTGSSSASGNSAYIGEIQVEEGYPTSHIPTAGATVARGADVCAMTGTELAAILATGAGTLYVEWSRPVPTPSTTAVSLSDGTGNNVIWICTDASNMLYAVTAAGAVQASATLTSGLGTAGALYRQAVAWSANDFQGASNGTVTAVDSSGSVPTGLNRLDIGNLLGTSSFHTGHIRRVMLWPRRLSAAELAALTQS